MTTSRTIHIVILLLSLALRLAWAFSQSAEPDKRLGDQFEYLQLGRNFLTTGEFRFKDDRFDQYVYAYRTPGYPLMVAAMGGNVTAIRIAQAVLDTSTVLAIYLLARRLGSNSAALIAAGFVAVNPFLIYFTGLILSETLFTAMLAWGMALLMGFPRSKISPWAGLVILAAAVQVRPSVLGLIPILALVAAIGRGRLAMLLYPLVAGALVIAALFPWAWRNAHHPQLKTWVWTTTNNGVTLYDGFHNAATGASDQRGFLDRLMPVLKPKTEIQRDEWLGTHARSWMVSNPGRSFVLAGIKIARTWSPFPQSSEYGSRLYVLTGLIYSLPFDILIFLGLWKGAGGKTLKVYCALPAIYFTGIHALSVGSLRYRVPCEAPMALMAACGAMMLFWIFRGGRKSETI